MRRFRVLVAATMVVGLIIGLGHSPPSAFAVSVTVGQGDYPCTELGLGQAIVGAAENGTVTFDCDDPTIGLSAGSAIVVEQSVTIDGSNNGNPIILDGLDKSSFFYVVSHATLTLKHITLKDGRNTTSSPLQIDSLSAAHITDVTFESNVGRLGGAIQSSGSLTITQSHFESNASSQGGAIHIGGGVATITQSTFDSNKANTLDETHFGGAIFIEQSGNTTISQSRFTSNSATNSGGAIYSAGLLAAVITQSTFESNSANFGGAIYDQGSATITQNTFINNTASVDGSTISASLISSRNTYIGWSTIVQPSSTEPAINIQRPIILEGVILAGQGPHCDFDQSFPITDSYTLSSDTSCNLDGEGSQQNVSDLGLGLLTTTTINGVQQSYYPLVEGSPAHNGGPATCDTAADEDADSDPDQLGTPRPQEGFCDIGAYEVVFNAAPAVDAGGPYTGNEGIAVTLTGSATDPENDALTYKWTYAPGPGTDSGASCTFANDEAAQTTITCDDDGTFTVTLRVSDSRHDAVTDQADVTLVNVAPEIIDFHADPNPALTGQLVNLSLDVDDVQNDRADMNQRIYFECGGGVQVSEGICRYDRGGSYQVSVQVRDGDLGISRQSFTLQVYDQATLCANAWTGQLRMVDEGDSCGRSEDLIHLPEDGPVDLCVNRWNGALTAADDCGRSEYPVQVRGQATLAVCVNTWNGALRASEQCSRSEFEAWL